MRNGRCGSRQLPSLGTLVFLLAAPVLAALVLVVPRGAGAQEPTPAMLQEAARRTGLSEQELLRRYAAERGAVTPADTLAPPGRTALPPARPDVVLPFALELAAADTAAGLSDPAAAPAGALFGADFFRLEPGLFAPPSFGPVPPDYLVGPGDQLLVDVYGEVEFRLERVVERDGSVILPKGGKVTCAGRTLAQVTRDVRDKLASSYSGIDPAGDGGTTFVDVTLGALRAIRVFVVGEARQPGAYELTSVSTAFTALYAAGGPNAAGSLRDVRVLRGDVQIGAVDLYRYLLEGRRGDDPVLRDGDTVLVPPRGATVRIEGEVRRPLSFELLPDDGVRDLIRYAGGFTAEAVTDVVHVDRIVPAPVRADERPDRERAELDLRDKMKHLLRDGDVVTVGRIPDRLDNWVEILGNVKHPGRYAYVAGSTVADLVTRAGGIWPDTVLERALMERTDPDLTRRNFELHLAAALSGEAPVALQAMDQLHVYSKWDLADRYTVRISGEVRAPGEYEWRENMTLRDLVLKAGGLKESADLVKAEVSRLRRDAVESRDIGSPPERMVDVLEVALGADWLQAGNAFRLEPHDEVAVRRLPWWRLQRVVKVQGEVHYPGDYVLESPDERLSSLIARAGGLKPTAFAPGARIVRARDGVGNLALDLDRALRSPGGEQDALLESGDEILVPTEPTTVKVTGAVGYPTSIVFESGRSIGDYVARAGGYADKADDGKTYVVYPNGMSRQVRRIWRDPSVMAGSTIVVPYRQPNDGAGKLETLKEIASIFASVATVWLVIDRTK